MSGSSHDLDRNRLVARGRHPSMPLLREVAFSMTFPNPAATLHQNRCSPFPKRRLRQSWRRALMSGECLAREMASVEEVNPGIW